MIPGALPVPMLSTALDLTTTIEANQSRCVNKARYRSDGKYSSTSAKVIAQVWVWYVDEVLYQVNEQYMDAADNIDDEIDSSFNDSADDVREANKNGASVKSSVKCRTGFF